MYQLGIIACVDRHYGKAQLKNFWVEPRKLRNYTSFWMSVCIYRNILITWVSFEKENQNLPGSRLHIEAILQNFKPPQRKKYINANKIHKSCASPFPRPPKINKINGCCLITPVLSCEKRKISNYTTALVWPQRYKDSLTSSVSFVLVPEK